MHIARDAHAFAFERLLLFQARQPYAQPPVRYDANRPRDECDGGQHIQVKRPGLEIEWRGNDKGKWLRSVLPFAPGNPGANPKEVMAVWKPAIMSRTGPGIFQPVGITTFQLITKLNFIGC